MNCKITIVLILVTHHSFANNICPDKRVECGKEETCCAKSTDSYACCPSISAVCCSDGLHCCPENTFCDLPRRKCLTFSRTPTLFAENVIGDGVSWNDTEIPDWFYRVNYCVYWLNPYKQFRNKQCAEILQQTEQWDICGGDHIGEDCYRNIRFELSSPSGAPGWWAAVQVLSNSAEWAQQFIFKVPINPPVWLQNVQLCFYRNSAPFCAPTNQWTPGFQYDNHILGAFGFVAPI